jgi:hypothetical protein
MKIRKTGAECEAPVNQCKQYIFFIVGRKKTIKMAVDTTKAFLSEYGS